VDSDVAVPAFFLAEGRGQIVTWDARCVSLWGYTKQGVQELTVPELFNPGFDISYFRNLPPGEARVESAAIRRKDGRKIKVEFSCEKVRLAGSDFLQCAVTPHHDVVRSALSLAKIIEGIPCLFFVADADGHLLAWNHHWADAVNVQSDMLARAQVADFFKGPAFEMVREKMADALELGTASYEAIMQSSQGVFKPYLFTFARRLLAGQPWLFCSGIDITERKAAELRLLVNERAMDACVNAIAIFGRRGPENPIEYVNPAFCALTGYSKEECLGRDPSFMNAEDLDVEERSKIQAALSANKSVHAVLRNRNKKGNIIWNDLTIDPVVDDDGRVSHFVAVIQDVTEAKRSEEQLRHLATHDPLTGLANRTAMQDRLKASIDRARRDESCVAVVYVDLDNFKVVNDTMGHAAGDMLLQTLAQRLAASVRAGDTVARIGGDEFVAVINDCQGIDHVGELVERLHGNFIEPVGAGIKEILPSASIGISLFPHDGDEAYTILRAADAAMYRAKTSGKNQFRFYSAEMDLTVHNYLERETSLRAAIDRDELFLQYQPKVDLESGKIVGAEVLVRWKHPEDGILYPKDFIRIAEESGLIIPLGEWVLRHACATLRHIHREGFPHFSLSVNLSARQLRDRTFAQKVTDILSSYALPCHALELEVTESHLMENPERAAITLGALRALGLKISIDDFGTGYSSLSHLQKFPIEFVKMDSAFLSDLTHNGHAVIAQAIIALAHNLHLRVVAEGVETVAQVDFLRMHRCDHIQGNYFSPPIAESALLELLHTRAGLQ
jgi:diguanylate cyclase (GGDEF)-like protein/PAS domain S-box-containing protein